MEDEVVEVYYNNCSAVAEMITSLLLLLLPPNHQEVHETPHEARRSAPVKRNIQKIMSRQTALAWLAVKRRSNPARKHRVVKQKRKKVQYSSNATPRFDLTVHCGILYMLTR